MATPDSSFVAQMNAALSSELPMRRLRQNTTVALYAGLWGSHQPLDGKRTLRVILATVRNAVAGGKPSTTLGDLDWIILQLQTFDEDSPAWVELFNVLQADASKMDASSTNTPTANKNRIRYDPNSKNAHTMEMVNADWLSNVDLVQTSADASVPRPLSVLDRKRVEYILPDRDDIRVFIEQMVAKQPLQQKMNALHGLSREASLLSAVNEWRTWILREP